MKVLFINSREDAQQNVGGDTIQMNNTRTALEKLGLRIELCCLDELNRLPACDLAHVFNIQTPEAAWRAFQALQAKGIPVVISPIYWDLYAYWYEQALVNWRRWRQLSGWLGKRRTGKVYEAWQAFKAPANSQWKIQRRLLEQAIRVLPNSNSEAKLLQRYFSLRKDFQQKVDVVTNAIDPSLYQTLPEPDQDFQQVYGLEDFILEVGTLYSVKNQLGLIEALFDLPISLVFIGRVRAEEQAYALRCSERAQQRGNVYFIDNVPHDKLPGIYALAAVHALPSWRETPGLVSLEAAAAGCRIVTTSIGSTHDYFGELAWYCYPNDYQSIRSSVEAALHTPKSDELRKRILAEYTWDKAAEQTLYSYEKALS